MRELLVAAEKAHDSEEINTDWAIQQNAELGAESVQVWRALKKYTEEHTEARQVVTSVPAEDGYAAWIKLHRRFGMALAMRQGTVLANFSQMGLVKMKTPPRRAAR